MSEMDSPADGETPSTNELRTSVDNEAPNKDASNDTVIDKIPEATTAGERDTEPSLAAPATQDSTTQVLQFFAGAPDGVLVAIAISIAAFIYAIFGEFGLLVIGIVAGVLLHAHWVGLHGEKEAGIGQLEKALEGRGAQKIKSMLDIEEDEEDTKEIGFKDFRPETAAALDEIVVRTVKDYVSYWYAPIHPGEESVPKSAKATLVQFIRSVARTLSKKRPADAFILFMTNTSSIVTTFFGELGNAIKENQDIDVAPEDAVGLYLSAHPDSTLSYLLDEKQQQTRFLREADEMLRHHIDKPTYNCGFAKTFLQQTLAWDVFETTLKTISKPEWFNGWIVYLLEEGEPDLLQAIDAGMSNESKAAMKPNQDRKEHGHEKRMSRAVDDQAMQEARRLSELMAEEDMRRAREAANVSPAIMEEPAQMSAQESSNDIETPTLPPRREINHSAKESKSSFTSFDQLPTPKVVTEEPSEIPTDTSPAAQATPALTLHNANITILDDSMPGDKGRTLRSKPSDDYLVQIEPQDSRHPGWMIVRRYDDFETLHEVLKRIAAVSGASGFGKNHANLPTWKGQTKSGLRIGLENYLMSACHYQPLAESVGLKRFLEKEHQGPTGKNSPSIGWPTPAAFENMGKGLVDGLMVAGKGVGDGGKSVFGGMTGVFSGNRNRSDSKASMKSPKPSRSSTSLSSQVDGVTVNGILPTPSTNGTPGRDRSDSKNNLKPLSISRSSTSLPRLAEDGQADEATALSRKSTNPRLRIPAEDTPPASLQPAVEPIMGSPKEERTPTFEALKVSDVTSSTLDVASSRTSISETSDDASSLKRPEGVPRDASFDLGSLHLPPPPSDMPDDYGLSLDGPPSLAQISLDQTRTSTDTFASEKAPSAPAPLKLKLERKEPEPFTEQETRDALELIFAMISSLYTLSSAWSLRLTLLTAAKTFLLRPGNPSLLYIQTLIQDSVIGANTSDEGIAAHLRKVRENSLPTEEELAQWPPEMSEAEKAKLRVKARALLLEKGIPAALTGVMGMQATNQALGRVFDTLQDGRVLRGLMFGLLMQGVSLLTH